MNIIIIIIFMSYFKYDRIISSKLSIFQSFLVIRTKTTILD